MGEGAGAQFVTVIRVLLASPIPLLLVLADSVLKNSSRSDGLHLIMAPLFPKAKVGFSRELRLS